MPRSMATEFETWLETATAIADEAGGVLMEGWRREPAVRKKGAIDLVTDFDLRSEELLRDRMGRAFPEHALIAEEGEDERAEGEWVWYVDPLDGTTNFAHGHFFFSVSLGLARHGRPVLGVVHAPALGTTWAGAEGIGCRRNEAPCTVSSASALGDALVASGFPYDRAESAENNLSETSHIVPQTTGLSPLWLGCARSRIGRRRNLRRVLGAEAQALGRLRRDGDGPSRWRARHDLRRR